MLDVFKYEKREWYPHMKPNDVEIWNRFVAENPTMYDEVQYDVAVGTGSAFPKEEDRNLAAGFELLTKKKIDVVGYKNNIVDIVEIKPNAGPSSLGQLKGYEILWRNENKKYTNTRAVLLTDFIQNDMLFLADQMKILIIKV